MQTCVGRGWRGGGEEQSGGRAGRLGWHCRVARQPQRSPSLASRVVMPSLSPKAPTQLSHPTSAHPAVVFAPCSSNTPFLLQALRRGGVDETDLASLLSNPQILREQRRVRRVMPQVLLHSCVFVHLFINGAMLCDPSTSGKPCLPGAARPAAISTVYHAPHAAYVATHAPARSWS